MLNRRNFVKAGLGLGATMMVAGCSNTPAADKKGEAKGHVYYLNFKPEQDEQWQEIAQLYKDETGVEVTVKTAAAGQYESTLKAEMGKSEFPTMFQVNGPVGLASWKDYCADLDGSDIVSNCTNDSFKLTGDDGKIKGVAYVIESYGIIFNKELLEKAGHKQEEIKDFASLEKVVKDITANSQKLGFSAFNAAGMDKSSDWRFKTHLANLPIYYEYKKDNIKTTKAIKGTYLDNYRKIFDLYINNSTTNPALLSTVTADMCTSEFVTKKAVFYQNGTWEYEKVAELGEDKLGMLPIYIGVDGEDKQGLCTGSENYWCVNKNAKEEDVKATLDFMNWCVNSDTGVKCLCGGKGAMPSGGNGCGFTIPFKKNLESQNPLVNIANKYVADRKTPVDWCFSTMPSEAWKNGVGSALTKYAANQSDATWAEVVSAFVDGWKSEAEKAK